MDQNTQTPTETSSSSTSPMKKNNTAAIAAAAVIVVAIVAFAMSQSGKNPSSVSMTTTSDNKTTSSSTVIADTASYKDGTYTVEGEYRSPAGQESIGVTLTLKDNVITDATVVSKATNSISIKMQGLFIEGFKASVIGKNINEVNLNKISGSSLTPKGFNDAIAKVKAQAKA